MTVISVYNIKGGVGKTTTCVNLAYLAAQDGFSTLLCDLDPQGSASFYFRIRPTKKYNTKKFIQGGKKVEGHIKETDYENLDLLPSDISYRNLDLKFDRKKRSKKRLREILSTIGNQYRLILLDCPPNITLVSENIFFASDYILVPLIPTTLSLLTYNKLINFFLQKKLDEQKLMVFFSMVEKRKKLHQETINGSTAFRGRFLRNHIPYLSDIEKMGIHREPLPCFRPKSKAVESYKRIWHDIKKTIKL